MHVEDCELLRRWLVSKIRKITEADPFTLAKYILALIRKDKPEDELRKFCFRQLYAFFRKGTFTFVDLLFLVVKTGSYLKDVAEDDDDIYDPTDLPSDTPIVPGDPALDSNGHTLKKTMNSGMSYNAAGMNASTSFSSSTETGESSVGNYSPSFSSKQKFDYSEAPLYVPTATKGGKTTAAVSSATSSTCNDDSKHERCMDYEITSDNGSSVNIPMKPPLPSLPPPTLPPLPDSPPPEFYAPEPYNPESPGMNMDSERRSYIHYKKSHGHHISGFSGTSGAKSINYENSFPPYKPQRTRELVGVTLSNNSSGGGMNENVEKVSEKSYKRKNIEDYGAPKKVPKLSFNKRVLEVRRIPTNLNQVRYLIQHFRKFGTVNHIQIEYESDPQAALIEYTTEEEATAAYRCPEPVLSNRFIKVFYQRIKSNVEEAENVNTEHDSSSAYYSRAASSSKTYYKPPPARASYKYTCAKNAEGSNAQKARSVTMNKQLEIYNKTYELYQQQMKSQKLMLMKLVSSTKPAHKEVLKKLMLDMTEKIKRMQEELKVMYKVLKENSQATAIKPSSSKSIPIKEMFNKSQENQKTEEELREEVKRLEAKAKDLGILDASELSIENQEDNLSAGDKKLGSCVEEKAGSSSSCSTATNKLPDLDYRPKNLLSELTDIKKANMKKHLSGHLGVLAAYELKDNFDAEKEKLLPIVKEEELGSSSCSTASKMLLNPDSPKSLLLSELSDDIDKASLKNHFQKFGVVENMDDARIDKSIIITFSSSDEAEKAFLNGKKFGDKDLNLDFFSGLNLKTEEPKSATVPGEHEFKDMLALLYGDDEEEEVESEERSWKR